MEDDDDDVAAAAVIIGDTDKDEPDNGNPFTATAVDTAFTISPPPPLLLLDVLIVVVYAISGDTTADVGDVCTSTGEITVMVVAGGHHQDHPTQQKAVSTGTKTQLKTHITKRNPKNPITIIRGGLGWFGCGGCSPDRNPRYKTGGDDESHLSFFDTEGDLCRS